MIDKIFNAMIVVLAVLGALTWLFFGGVVIGLQRQGYFDGLASWFAFGLLVGHVFTGFLAVVCIWAYTKSNQEQRSKLHYVSGLLGRPAR